MKKTFLSLVYAASWINCNNAMEEVPHSVQLKQIAFEVETQESEGCFPLTFLTKILKKHATGSLMSVNPVKVTGQESLLTAVLQNNPTMVLQYMLNGADVNERASNGWTPLHYAARDRNGMIARVLMASPIIDISIRTPDGETARDILNRRRIIPTEEEMWVTIKDTVQNKDIVNKSSLQCNEDRTLFLIALFNHYEQQEYPYLIRGNALISKKSGKKFVEVTPSI